MANAYANVGNVDQGGNIDISAGASNVGHTTATTTTNVIQNNPIMETGTVQTLEPPPLLGQ